MYKAMPTLPVSELRTRQAEIIAQLDDTPILLTQRGHGAGVLIHPDQWNRLLEYLEDQEDLIAALEAELAAAAGTEQLVEADLDELKAMAKGASLPT